MKATLEFNLPEEQAEHYNAINGTAFRYCLQELDGELRNYIKHGHTFEDAHEVLMATRKHLHDLIHDNDLVLE
jgi:hypothetical protein